MLAMCTHDHFKKAMAELCSILTAAVLSFFIMPATMAQEQADPQSLWERASIYRDEWGTPHVYAEDPRALAFAFGYAQAEDHLESMLAAYRVANGRAAEVFGEYFAQSDEFNLKLGHALLARMMLPELDNLSRDLCEGFAMGANAWIVEHPGKVPTWADGVKPEDILALLHCYLMSMAPFDLPNTYRFSPAAVTGNAWAISPSQSESGESLLVINPHTAYDGPFQWCEAHLACGNMNMAGATLFGLPVILQGHNAVLGWALSPNQPDFADMYIESALNVRQEDDGTEKKLEPLETRMLQMLLLANSRSYYVNTTQGLQPHSISCLDTPRGPVMGMLRGRMCSWRIGGYHDFGTLNQLMQMACATDLASFQAALALQQLPCFHVVYADQAGNIAYFYNAKVQEKAAFIAPKRPPQEAAEKEKDSQTPTLIDWSTPQLSNNLLFAWGNIVPEQALPSIVNPESGYVQACGNPPWTATEKSSIKEENYPKWFIQDRDTYRAQRVRRLLSMGKRSFRDCQSMLYDSVVPYAMEFVPQLLKTAKEQPDFVANAHPDLSVGLDLLKSWNYLADSHSAGMTFFEAWWTALRNANVPANTPVALADASLYRAMRENPDAMRDNALNAAVDAARMMRNEFQTLTVPWGDVHVVRRGGKETPVAGAAAGEPIFITSDFVYQSRKWPVTYGYGFAMVVSFGERPTAVSMLPFGASEDPASPHYTDQLKLMSERRFKVARFQLEDVQRNAIEARGKRLSLRPRGVEGVFTLRAITAEGTPAAAFEARLTTSVDTAGKLPDGMVPFTLFVKAERVPKDIPIDTIMEIFIPPVLCAREDLENLAVYVCDSANTWTRLEEQHLDAQSRTFTASDSIGPRVYAVLGPERFRAARLDAGETATPLSAIAAQKPADAPQAAQTLEPGPRPVMPASELPAGTGTRRFEFKTMQGIPPRHKQDTIKMREKDDTSDAIDGDTLPRLKVDSDEETGRDDTSTEEMPKPRDKKQTQIEYMPDEHQSSQDYFVGDVKEVQKHNREVFKKMGIDVPDPEKQAKKAKKEAKRAAKQAAQKAHVAEEAEKGKKSAKSSSQETSSSKPKTNFTGGSR